MNNVVFDKEQHKQLVAAATEDGVQVVHTICEGDGGFTFAWRRCDNFGKRMVEVSVTWCHANDTFKKRIGSFLALDAFYAENTILLPVGTDCNSTTVNNIRQIFLAAKLSNYSGLLI